MELYGENLETQEQLEELMRMIEEQRAKITATGPEGWGRKYARGWTDAQILTVTLVLAGCIVAVVVLMLVRG